MSAENKLPILPSAFDSHQPPAQELIDKCVHCGFCLPVCPTYVLWGEEMDSPRGRIYLMKMAAQRRRHAQRKIRQPFRFLPRLHGLHARLPLRRRIRQTHRSHARANRTQLQSPRFRQIPSPPAIRNLPASRLASISSAGRSSSTKNPACNPLLRAIGFFKLLPKSLAAMDTLLPPVTPTEPVAHSLSRKAKSAGVSASSSAASSAPFSRTSTPPPPGSSPSRAAKSSPHKIKPVAARSASTPEKNPRRLPSPATPSTSSNKPTSSPSSSTPRAAAPT